MPYGADIRWKILRFIFVGAADSARFVASIVAWSRTDHSHSHLLKKSYGAGKTSLFSVVSMVKIFRWFARNRPIRHADECSAEFSGSMNDRECTIVWLLWWCRRLLYDASPTGTDLWPPAIAPRLMLTEASRSDCAARLLISTSSPWSVTPTWSMLSWSSASW